jgi:hypothetical protein
LNDWKTAICKHYAQHRASISRQPQRLRRCSPVAVRATP